MTLNVCSCLGCGGPLEWGGSSEGDLLQWSLSSRLAIGRFIVERDSVFGCECKFGGGKT